MTAPPPRLVIGNKNTSSWSLRPWLLMRRLGLPFEEVHINLRAPDKKEQILALSPSGKIPALITGDLTVWDTLAITEFLAEHHRDKLVWPENEEARAVARSVSAEMHSGFQALREHCPMDLTARSPKAELPDSVAADVRRVGHRSGRTAAPDSARGDRSCSPSFVPPMPCTRPWPHVFVPTSRTSRVMATTVSPSATSTPSSQCRR